MIDLLLRNNALSFQNTLLVLKGLSDFHKLVLTVLKTSVEKNEPWEKYDTEGENFFTPEILKKTFHVNFQIPWHLVNLVKYLWKFQTDQSH